MFSEEFLFFRSNFKIEKHKEVFSKDFTSKHFSGLVDWCFRNALQKFHKQSKSFRTQSEKKTIQFFIRKQKKTYGIVPLDTPNSVFGFDNTAETIFALINQLFFAPRHSKNSKIWPSSKKTVSPKFTSKQIEGSSANCAENFLPKITFAQSPIFRPIARKDNQYNFYSISFQRK